MPKTKETKTTETKSKEAKTPKSKGQALTFKCGRCQKEFPTDDMRIIARFFPPMVVCHDCEAEVR
jgi:hypothetical protein